MLCVSVRLQLATKVQQEPDQLRPATEIDPLERAAVALPELAELAWAAVGLGEALIQAADAVHAASMKPRRPARIGSLADLTQ